ncbi:MAG: hypothetical protein KDD66_07670 [Bdellovibrionales bacterium]|nr:hypothetical protein [Bdellovibrionales bacterium]
MLRFAAAVLLYSLFFPASAFAYLDPGTGSMLLQVLLAGLAGLAVAWKYLWKQVTRPFKRSSGENSSEAKPNEEPETNGKAQ